MRSARIAKLVMTFGGRTEPSAVDDRGALSIESSGAVHRLIDNDMSSNNLLLAPRIAALLIAESMLLSEQCGSVSKSIQLGCWCNKAPM